MGNKVLYHYCSLETFKKTIESREIRFFDLSYLKDPDGLTFLKERIDCAAKLRGYCDEFFSRTSIKNIMKNSIYFVFCLTEEYDSPYMWKVHADAGNGVCIGFNEDKLKSWASGIINTQILGRDAGALSFKSACLKEVKYFCTPGIFDYLYTNCDAANHLAPFTKHCSFGHEKEYRVVINAKGRSWAPIGNAMNENGEENGHEPMSKSSDDDVIQAVKLIGEGLTNHYVIDIPFDLKMIDSVCVGPNCRHEKNQIRAMYSEALCKEICQKSDLSMSEVSNMNFPSDVMVFKSGEIIEEPYSD